MAQKGLALHTWTLDSTPLGEVLQVARRTGWNAVELRQVDFTRAFEDGRSADDVLAQVREGGLPVACVGATHGWMFAEGTERRRLFGLLEDACRWAAALECGTVMSPADMDSGAREQAAESVREAGALAARHGVRLAIEPPSQAEQLNTVERVREILAASGHAHCGLLVDTYHIGRRGGGPHTLADVVGEEIVYVQYSDVPAQPGAPDATTNRLPPGLGTVPFADLFGLLDEKGYDGYLSYEAPNPAAWARDPDEVAREALDLTRALLR